MTALSTIFLAFSMSADAFAIAVSKGASLRHPKPSEALKTGLVFGSIEAMTPIIGWGAGALASNFVTAIDHWIAFVILSALGVKMIIDSATRKEHHEKPSRHKLRSLALAGLGSSIDAMGVGVTLAFVDADIWITAAAIGTATFLMASLGIMAGHIIGRKVGKIAEAMGGAVLIVIGAKILLEHTDVIRQSLSNAA